jgi:hypothetical protein
LSPLYIWLNWKSSQKIFTHKPNISQKYHSSCMRFYATADVHQNGWKVIGLRSKSSKCHFRHFQDFIQNSVKSFRPYAICTWTLIEKSQQVFLKSQVHTPVSKVRWFQ